MKVLFSNPPWWIELGTLQLEDGTRIDGSIAGVRAGSRWPYTDACRSRPGNFVFGDYLPYPFFMGYAATYLARETGAEVVLRDSIATRESMKSYASYIREQQFDYIFIESATPSWDADSELIAGLSKLSPRSRIVLTGPIASKGEQLLAEHPIHAVIKGEYEKGAVRVINGESGVIDFDLLTLDEMNAAPFPWRDAATAHHYWDPTPRGQIAPQAQVWSSRGCPYKCIFCVWPATMTSNDPDGTGRRGVRQYTPDYMEAYLTEIVERWGYKSIYFDDDTFNLGNSHVVRMCEVMQRIGLPWSAMCRADTIRKETWALMREAGCFGVKIGFESGSQFVVDQIVNKHLDLDYAAEVVRTCKRVGMSVHGTFTYGLPGETPEQMRQTKAYIAALPFDSVQESGTAEIEGTPLHTLSSAGGLEAYAGASTDADYRREIDGNMKMRKLAEELRES